eukprot:3396780-Amphidinium_carterae.1
MIGDGSGHELRIGSTMQVGGCYNTISWTSWTHPSPWERSTFWHSTAMFVRFTAKWVQNRSCKTKLLGSLAVSLAVLCICLLGSKLLKYTPFKSKRTN